MEKAGGYIGILIGATILSGGALFPVLVLVVGFVFLVGLLDSFGNASSERQTDLDTPSNGNPSLTNRSPHSMAPRRAYSRIPETDDGSDERDCEEALLAEYEQDSYIDTYGRTPDYIPDEHPLADSYDPDMGYSWNDYMDMQTNQD